MYRHVFQMFVNIVEIKLEKKDMKKFHDALKTIYGPKSSGAPTLLSADGSTLPTDKEAILKRWAEHSHDIDLLYLQPTV